MLKKQRLALMEGKRHDKRPRYSRNGRDREPFDPDVAAAFNRSVEAKAAAGDPDALALIRALSNTGET